MAEDQKQKLENANPQLHPSQDVEKNVAAGIDDDMPDPDDVPGGWSSTMQKRPDILQSDADAQDQETEDNPSYSHDSHQ